LAELNFPDFTRTIRSDAESSGRTLRRHSLLNDRAIKKTTKNVDFPKTVNQAALRSDDSC